MMSASLRGGYSYRCVGLLLDAAVERDHYSLRSGSENLREGGEFE